MWLSKLNLLLLACCSQWGHKELDMTEQLNNNSYKMQFLSQCSIATCDYCIRYADKEHSHNSRMFYWMVLIAQGTLPRLVKPHNPLPSTSPRSVDHKDCDKTGAREPGIPSTPRYLPGPHFSQTPHSLIPMLDSWKVPLLPLI